MRRIVAFCSSVVVAGVIVVAALGASGSAQVVARIDTGLGPCSETGGLGSLWVGVGGAGTLVRIDPATNTVTGSVDVGVGPCGVAIGAGSVWVDGYGTSSVIRVDPARMKVTRRIPMRDQIWDVAYGAGAVWATEPNRGYVDRINPKTNKVGRRIQITQSGPGQPPLRRRRGLGRLARRPPRLPDRRAHEPRHERAGRPDAALGRGHRAAPIWVSNNGSNTVSRIDPKTRKVVATIQVGQGPENAAVATDGTVFVPNVGRGHGLADRPGDEHRHPDDPGRHQAVPGRQRVRRHLGSERRRHGGLPPARQLSLTPDLRKRTLT